MKGLYKEERGGGGLTFAICTFVRKESNGSSANGYLQRKVLYSFPVQLPSTGHNKAFMSPCVPFSKAAGRVKC